MRRILLLLLAAAIIFPSCSLDALERTMNGFGDWIGGDAETPSPSRVTDAVENAGKEDVTTSDGKITLTVGDGKNVNIPIDTEVSAMLPPASDELMNSLRDQIYADGTNKAFANAMNKPVSDPDTVEGAKGSATIVSSAINDVVNNAGTIDAEYEDILNNVQAISNALAEIGGDGTSVSQGDAITIMLATDLAMSVLDSAKTDGNNNITGFDTDSVTGDKLNSLLASAQLLSDFTAKAGNTSLSTPVNNLMDSVKNILKDNE